MNAAKIKKVVYREFTKSPAKTGFLLAMCPIALYFVVPLLLPEKSPKIKAGTDQRALVVPSDRPPFMPAVETIPTETAARPAWQELLCWTEQDPLMRPAEWQSEWRDPFHAIRSEPVDDVEEEEETAPEPAAVQVVDKTPEDLGITLTATVVGPQLRLATINKQTYREHDLIPVEEDSDDSLEPRVREPTAGFTLLKVDRRSVLLSRNGKEFELSIQETRVRSGRTSISRVHRH
ncbi:MAG: hypothetical protein ACC628_20150 [Pirellulaceae bacterium]